MKNIETDRPNKNLFQIFKKDIVPYKPLSKKEEGVMVKAGKAGREKLVLHNLFLVICIATKYKNRGVDFLDLIQEGIMGLFEALKKFKPEREVKFSTFAYYCIWQSILNALLDQSRTIRNPRSVTRELNEILKTEKWLYQKLGRWPENQETAEIMDTSLARIEKIKNLRNQSRSVSLDAPINRHSQSESQSLLEDFLPDENSGLLEDFLPGKKGPPIEAAIYQKELEAVWQITCQALRCNTYKISKIVALLKKNAEMNLQKILEKLEIDQLTAEEKKFYIYYKRQCGSTLQEIGDEFNQSRQWINEIEKEVEKRLQLPKWKTELEKFL